VRDLKVRHPKPEAFLLWAKNAVGSMSKTLPGAAEVPGGGRGPVRSKTFEEA